MSQTTCYPHPKPVIIPSSFQKGCPTSWISIWVLGTLSDREGSHLTLGFMGQEMQALYNVEARCHLTETEIGASKVRGYGRPGTIRTMKYVDKER